MGVEKVVKHFSHEIKVTNKTHIPCKVCKTEFKRFRTTQNCCSKECDHKLKEEKNVRADSRGNGTEKTSSGSQRHEVSIANETGHSRWESDKSKKKIFGQIKKGASKKETFLSLKERYETKKLSCKKKAKASKIPARSKDKGRRDAALFRIKNEKIAELGKICSSCGQWFDRITLSHYIPVSLRRDLEIVPEASFLQCIEDHYHYEHLHGEYIKGFINLPAILAFLEANDLKRYNLVLGAIEKAEK